LIPRPAYCQGENPGEIPAPFTLTWAGTTSEDLTFKVGEIQITVSKKYNNIKWNSKTGMVSSVINGAEKPIPYTGNSLGSIPVGGLTEQEIDIHGATLDYDYWYY
jgi:hypothetical protein